MVMKTFKTDGPQSCGIVELDKDDVVTGFHEKVVNPPSNLANGAVYILDPKLIRKLAEFTPTAHDLSKQLIPAELGKISTFYNNVYYQDIAAPESLEAA